MDMYHSLNDPTTFNRIQSTDASPTSSQYSGFSSSHGSQNPQHLSPGFSPVSPWRDEEAAARLENLRERISEKRIMLEALITANQTHSSDSSDDQAAIEDLKRKIILLERQILSHQKSSTYSMKPLSPARKSEVDTLIIQHRNLKCESNILTQVTIPQLILKIRNTDNRLADAKRELSELRGSRSGSGDVDLAGMRSGVSEEDQLKARAAVLLQARITELTGLLPNIGGGGSLDTEPARLLEGHFSRIGAEKESNENHVTDIERTTSILKDAISSICHKLETNELRLRCVTLSVTSPKVEEQRWEESIGVSNEISKFINELKRETTDVLASQASPVLTSTHIANPILPATSSLTDLRKKTPEERAVFIKAEAERRMRERLAALGADTPSSFTAQSSLIERLNQEKAETVERIANIDREAREATRVHSVLSTEMQMDMDKDVVQEKDSRSRMTKGEMMREEREPLAKARRKKEEERLDEIAIEQRLAQQKHEPDEIAAEKEWQRQERETVSQGERSAKARILNKEDIAKIGSGPKVKTRDNDWPLNAVEAGPFPAPNVILRHPTILKSPTNESDHSSDSEDDGSLTRHAGQASGERHDITPIATSTLKPSTAANSASASSTRMYGDEAPAKAGATGQTEHSAEGQIADSWLPEPPKVPLSVTSPKGGSFRSPIASGPGNLFSLAHKPKGRNGSDPERVSSPPPRPPAASKPKFAAKSDRKDLLRKGEALKAMSTAAAPAKPNTSIAVEYVQQLDDQKGPSAIPIPSDDADTSAAAEEVADLSQEFLVKTLYQFAATRPDDLSFDVGTYIRAHPSNDPESGWWYGIISGTVAAGWFPKTYVERVREEPRPIKARVLYDFKASNADELTISEGSIIIILDRPERNWWRAEFEGAIGIVPANYIEEILDDDDSQYEPSSPTAATVTSEASEEVDRPLSSPIPRLKVTEPHHSVRSPSATVPPQLILNSVDNRSASTRSPSPTGLFGTSPVTSIPWMQIGRRRRTSISTEGSLNTVMVNRPASPATPLQTWVSIVDPSILESLSKEECKRQEAIYELIATEQTYLRDLQLIIEIFYGPLQGILPVSDLQTIFSNVEEIMLCNTALLSDLEDRQRQDAYFVNKLGDIFLQHSRNLQCYLVYCGNQMNASKFLQKKRASDKRIADFLKKCQQDPQCRHLDLSSFLLEPMQRITRYSLLLRQILHYTPKDHIDHLDMMKALKEAEDILEEANEAAREQENLSKLAEVSKLVDLEGLRNRLDLMNDTRLIGKRQHILEGPLQKMKSSRKLYAFLFNDLLILCQPNKTLSAKGYQYSLYRPPIPLNEVFVRDNDADETCFQVVHKEDVINLRASNVSVKRQWLNQLEAASDYILKAEREYQTGGGRVGLAHCIGTLRLVVYEGVMPVDSFDKVTVNAFCEVRLNRQVFKTKVVKDSAFPRWNQALVFSVTSLEEVLKLSVYNYGEYAQDEYLGTAEIALQFLEYYGSKETDKITLPLKDVPPGRPSGNISFYLSYKGA